MQVNGVRVLSGLLDRNEQERLLDDIRKITTKAPLFVPRMSKTGKPMTVRMTNCGSLGWVTDKENGYRYQSIHPVTGEAWPEIPESLLEIWQAHANFDKQPEACLINYYEPSAKMGLHQDRDEKNFDAPVLSVSLGDTCLFRVGGKKRNDKTQSIKLSSGDVVVLEGSARLAFHGVDRIYPGTSTLLRQEGRINLTMRRVSL